MAGGETPDLVIVGSLNLTQYIELGLDENIEPLIKSNQFNLSRIKPEILESIKIATDKDYLIGLPIWNQPWALAYNKDLFDKFAVPYPKDDMTWKQIRDMAKGLTRTVDNVQYYGLSADAVNRGAYQMSLPWTDWKNNKAVFQTDEWRIVFEFWTTLYKVPGFPPKRTTRAEYLTAFNEGRLAMIAAIFITKTSKHKEEAFQVVSVLLSDEVQLDMSKNLRMSVLDNQSIQSEFGKNITTSKNTAAFTRLKLAELQTFKNIPAYTFVNDAFDQVLYDGKDINTALREADEKMNKAIQEKLAK